MTETLASLALGVLLAATAPDAERTVCVPDDYGGWECGKGAQAPLPRALPPSVLQSTPRTSAPPPYLMDPARRPTVTRESLDRGYVSPQSDNAASVTATAAVKGTPQTETAASAMSPTSAPPTVLPSTERSEKSSAVAAAVNSQPEVANEMASVDAASTKVATQTPRSQSTPDSTMNTPKSVQPQAAATHAPVTTADSDSSVRDLRNPSLRPQRVIASVSRESDELLSLPDTSYTVQLSAARGFAGFVALRQKYAIAVEDTYVIRVKRGDEWLWLLLWRDFPDLASARDAIAQLPDSKGIWARNLAPLKAEVRATP